MNDFSYNCGQWRPQEDGSVVLMCPMEYHVGTLRGRSIGLLVDLIAYETPSYNAGQNTCNDSIMDVHIGIACQLLDDIPGKSWKHSARRSTWLW